jgi:broad specificity phosphatase PhoE
MNIYLVRHGEAAARWSQSRDAGLSPTGRDQAASLCERFAAEAPMRVVSSPLLRAQETAAPLASMWQVDVRIDPSYRELPPLVSFEERRAWLEVVMQRTWGEVDDALLEWRDAAWRSITSIDADTVIFSHFMVINAILSRLTGNERLVSFEPDYVSVTQLAGQGNALQLVGLGEELETTVL